MQSNTLGRISRMQRQIRAAQPHMPGTLAVTFDADYFFQLSQPLPDLLEFFLHDGQGGLEFL